jgi:hypothetical protein
MKVQMPLPCQTPAPSENYNQHRTRIQICTDSRDPNAIALPDPRIALVKVSQFIENGPTSRSAAGKR